ncbi:MAG TPA: prolyl oligopeptidase family serine peptidase [Acidisarcina sp.]
MATGSIPATAQGAPPGQSVEQIDKYQWLEDVSGERSLAWVKAENVRAETELQGDPRFLPFQAAALKVLESPDRLPVPTPDLHPDAVYNRWQDAQHVSGILRRTSLADYLTAQPQWQTVIDYDALGRQDNAKWVARDIICLYPGDSLCMVPLSAGGEDAESSREFDLKTAKFVEGGFVLPRSKESVGWLDKDTLLVARDWGEGTMTASGYPFVLKQWKRGQPLAEAREVFRGQPGDVAVQTQTSHDDRGNQATLILRGINFFEYEISLLTPGGAVRIAIPGKSEYEGLVNGRLIFTINEDWTPAGHSTSYPQGSVISIELASVQQDPAALRIATVFAPTATEFPQRVATTRTTVVLTTLQHVQGRAYVCTVDPSGVWTKKNLPLPENISVDIAATGESTDQFFLTTEGFLSPNSLLSGQAGTGELSVVKSLPAQFDPTHLVVEQLQATSRDGARVPYFVVHRKDMKYDGTNPTVLSAYGGFQVSMTPTYSGSAGKLWLERGGVYVLANIRGGGEFGPAWHEAGLKTHRQVIYDDFYAVAQYLVTRRITSPRRLGIAGGSNGGLLMGVEMTQHPEMWNAVYIAVPLLDMLRFEQIAAGASWVGEYGTVSKPDERAFLASISPYNQLRPTVKYPEPLIFTTTKDDRVGPVQARKFAARMKEFGKPFYYLEIVEGGHGPGADLKETARTAAVEFVYFTRKLMD